MPIIQIPYNWKPRPYQRAFWDYMEGGGKKAVMAWHRRAGKDEVALHWTCTAAMTRPATYWHMLPEAAQARKAIWSAINPHTGKRRIDEVFPHEIRSSTNETEMFIRFKSGSTWQVVGSDNFNSLVGSPPAGVVGSEWALANPLAWAYLRPILAENNGWAAFISTPRGRNHFHKMLEAAESDPQAFSQILTVDETKVFTPERLESELQDFIKEYGEGNGKSLFRQEYYCSFDAAVIGAIYGEWIEKAQQDGRICDVPYDPELLVSTGWDIGRSDATAIWFYQVLRGKVRLIDYHESSGKDIEFYCDLLKSKKYKYDKHWLPQDARKKLLEAKGRSFVQQAWEDHQVMMNTINETTHLNRHAATRKMLPMTWIDKTKCAQGIECARQYQYKWDEINRCFGKDPLHNEYSHGATALEIVGRVWHNPPVGEEPSSPRFFNDLTANDVFWPEKSDVTHRERI